MTEHTANMIVVEDNPYDAEIIVDAFKQYNSYLKAEILTDGQEALDYMGAACEDGGLAWLRLILLDLKLPKVHGLEVLRRLRADEATKDVPIVVFTSSLEENDRIDGLKGGANDYVVKPVKFSEFMEAVRRIYKTWVERGEPED